MPIENNDELYHQLNRLHRTDTENIQKELNWALEPNHRILTLSHPHYPRLLKEIGDPTNLLYIISNSLALNQPQFAIVGSRNPHLQYRSREIASEMAGKLSQAGLLPSLLAVWRSASTALIIKVLCDQKEKPSLFWAVGYHILYILIS